MKLFRAISSAEYKDLTSFGEFRAGMNSMEGKWFAEQEQDAIKWGWLLEPDGNFWIVEVEVASTIADGFFRIDRLDGIGPARYAESSNLVDATIVGFKNINRP